MMENPNLDISRNLAIADDYRHRRDLTLAQIGAKYGISKQRVLQVAASLGCKRRGSSDYLERVNDRRLTMVKMFVDGYHPRAIARHFGCARQSVYYNLNYYTTIDQLKKERKANRD